ncbi:MAG: YihY/virulence factor BrkB family protein [Synechococcus sp.]
MKLWPLVKYRWQKLLQQLSDSKPLRQRAVGQTKQGLVWTYRLVDQVTRQAISNQISTSAAEMAFNAMLSLFPTLLLIVAVLGKLVNSLDMLTTVATTLLQAVPGTVTSLLEEALLELSAGADRQVFSLGAITLLWVASAFLAPVIRALNNSYNVPLSARRPWWLNRLLAIGIFIGTMGLLFTSSILLLVGQTLLGWWGADRAGWSEFMVFFGQISLWPVSIGSVVLALAFIYRLAPSQQPRYAPVWPGAVAGGVIWLVVSMAFRLYVRSFGRYEAIYGGIQAVIVLLLWLYLSSFGILLGGEVNAAIHQLRVQHRRQMKDPLLLEGNESPPQSFPSSTYPIQGKK